MSNKLEVKTGEQDEIQTVGAVIKGRTFIPLVVVSAISVSLLLVMSLGDYWPAVCNVLDGALFGLIGGIYTMAVATSSLVVSWILIDDCSWFYKCSVLFCSSLLFMVCGTYYFYAYFEKVKCLPSVISKEVYPDNFSAISNNTYSHRKNRTFIMPKDINLSYLDLSDFVFLCYEAADLKETSAWTPILITICIFLGVLYFLFAIYLFISLDEG